MTSQQINRVKPGSLSSIPGVQDALGNLAEAANKAQSQDELIDIVTRAAVTFLGAPRDASDGVPDDEWNTPGRIDRWIAKELGRPDLGGFGVMVWYFSNLIQSFQAAPTTEEIERLIRRNALLLVGVPLSMAR